MSNEITPLQKDINQAVANANALVIKDGTGLQTASEYLRQCNLRIKAVGAEFDEICEKANAAHKAATARRKLHLDPVNRAKLIISGKVTVYHNQQQRILNEREAEKRRIAREESDAAKLAEAELLLAEGEPELAEAVLEEERPLEIVQAPAAEPEPEGLSYRDNWQFEVVAIKEIPAEYLQVNEKGIRAVVKALKGNTKIPGIRVFNKKTVIQKV